MSPIHLRYAARSDVGLRRPGNEDSGFADNSLIMVADGMGGHAAGELASAMAVATFAQIAGEPAAEEDVPEQLTDGVAELEERIGDVIAADPSNQGMGTTVTGLAPNGPHVVIFHVGDSRAYLLRDGQLAQITKDHTYVQSLVDAGEITPDEALRHPRRNLLNRAVDGIHPVSADLSVREARTGDRFLLCTDGLSGVVSDERIAAVLLEVADRTAAVSRLVDMALEAGAPDNVTVVVADVIDADNGDLDGRPVVVGAAGEPQNRARLPHVPWPEDEQPDPEEVSPPPPPPATEVPAPESIEPEPEQRSVWLKPALIVIAAAVGVLAIVGVSLTWWISQQWYVAESGGYVAIYRGVEGNLGPVPLQRVDEITDLPVNQLPSYDLGQLESGIETTTRAGAEEIVADLRRQAANCQVNPTDPGCPADESR